MLFIPPFKLLRYCSDIIEAEKCFCEAMIHQLPRQLRALFVMMTVNGFPTHVIMNNRDDSGSKPSMYNALTSNYRDSTQLISEKSIYNSLLIDLSKQVGDENRTLSDFGFDEPNYDNYARIVL